MKKILIVLLLAMTTFIFAGNDYTTQEVFNLVLDSNTLGIHGYTTQDVLNLVYDSTNEALKVTVNGGDVEVGTLNFTDATELTIATGVVTITQSVHTIDGETDADDDLVTISGGVEGDFLILYPENAARNITLINSTGNILTSNGLDYTIPDDGMVMLYHNGTDWLAFTGGSTFPMPNDTYATWVDNAGTGTVNAFKVNTSDEIDLGAPLNAGNLQLTADGETMTLADMAVSDTPAAGTDMSAGFKIDANDIFRYGTEADGSGGIQNEYAYINGAFIYGNAVTLADDAELAIKTGVAGFGQVFANDETMHFWFTSAGVLTKISGTANTDVADTDTDLCVYDAGAGISVKNRLGASYKVLIKITYMTP